MKWKYVDADPEASGDVGHWSAKKGDRYALIFPAMVPEIEMPYGVEMDMTTVDLSVVVEPALYRWTVGIRQSGKRISGSALTEEEAKQNAEIVFLRWEDKHIYDTARFDVAQFMAEVPA